MPAGICLPPDVTEKFKQALISGKITPEKLHAMSTGARTKLFTEIVGEGNAKFVNREFEQKLLLKHQELGMLNWAKKFSGVSAKEKAAMSARITAEFQRKQQRLYNPEEGQAFLEQLVRESLNRKFKVEPTLEQAKEIIRLQNNVDKTLAKASPNFTFKNQEDRLAHGLAKVNLENYVSDAKLQAGKISFKEKPLLKIKDSIGATPGVAKSLLSSLDDSLYGRQGIKVLLNVRTSDIWVKDFLKSFRDIGRQLKAGGDAKTVITSGDDRALNLIKADIYSRPNALNGKYKAGGFGLDAHSEEAYPSSLAEKIPAFGRLFKASEVAYNGGALRLRADLADRFIKIAEKQGVDTLDKEQAKGIGTLIGGMTGRGNLGKAEALGKDLNVILFSAKFLKGNFDTLTLHMLDSKATAFTRKQAAINMAGMITSIGGIMAVAHALDPNSVETDPRSTHFGKIKLYGHWTDITGGMGAMTTLAARVFIPTKHDGHWGLYSKGSSGTVSKLNDSSFGNKNAADTFDSFLQGKAAPATKVLLDVWKGQDYNGNKPSIKSETVGNITPLPIQNYNQLKDAKAASRLAGLIADGFGLSVSSTPKKNLLSNPTGSDQQLLQKIGKDRFQQYNDAYNQQVEKLMADPRLNGLSDDERQSRITGAKEAIKKHLYKQYNFKATKAKPDKASKSFVNSYK